MLALKREKPEWTWNKIWTIIVGSLVKESCGEYTTKANSEKMVSC
jgi:hypothetical protein